MGERIFIEGVRLSYPNLFTPKTHDDGKQSYTCALLVPKNHPAMAQIAAAREKVIRAEFNGKHMTKDLPIKDGDVGQIDPITRQPNGPGPAPGHWVLNTSAKQKPHTVDQNVQPILDPGKLYAGCYVNASVSVYAYFQATGNGITFGLDGVQWAADGERLDGRPEAGDMFKPVAGAPAPVAPAPGFTPPAPAFGAPAAPPAPAFGAPAAPAAFGPFGAPAPVAANPFG